MSDPLSVQDDYEAWEKRLRDEQISKVGTEYIKRFTSVNHVVFNSWRHLYWHFQRMTATIQPSRLNITVDEAKRQILSEMSDKYVSVLRGKDGIVRYRPLIYHQVIMAGRYIVTVHIKNVVFKTIREAVYWWETGMPEFFLGAKPPDVKHDVTPFFNIHPLTFSATRRSSIDRLPKIPFGDPQALEQYNWGLVENTIEEYIKKHNDEEEREDKREAAPAAAAASKQGNEIEHNVLYAKQTTYNKQAWKELYDAVFDSESNEEYRQMLHSHVKKNSLLLKIDNAYFPVISINDKHQSTIIFKIGFKSADNYISSLDKYLKIWFEENEPPSYEILKNTNGTLFKINLTGATGGSGQLLERNSGIFFWNYY
jgi:hypothetical protein